MAVLQTAGPGAWERRLQLLRDEDIRSFNERALTEQEKADRAAIRQAAGMPVDGIFGLDFLDGLEARGGRRMLSWIWLVEGGAEDENDPNYQECKFVFHT